MPIQFYIYIDENGIERAVARSTEQSFTDATEVEVEHPYDTLRPRIDVYFGNNALMPDARISFRGAKDGTSKTHVVVRFHRPESGVVSVRS